MFAFITPLVKKLLRRKKELDVLMDNSIYLLFLINRATRFQSHTSNLIWSFLFLRYIIVFRTFFFKCKIKTRDATWLHRQGIHWTFFFIVILSGYICCISVTGSPLHCVTWLDGTTDCIYITCCTGTDHATFRLGCLLSSYQCLPLNCQRILNSSLFVSNIGFIYQLVVHIPQYTWWGFS